MHYIYSDLRATLAGKDVPEEIKQKMLGMHEDNVVLKESLKTTTDKLNKAKQVRQEFSRGCQLNRDLFAVHQGAGQAIQRATRGECGVSTSKDTLFTPYE